MVLSGEHEERGILLVFLAAVSCGAVKGRACFSASEKEGSHSANPTPLASAAVFRSRCVWARAVKGEPYATKTALLCSPYQAIYLLGLNGNRGKFDSPSRSGDMGQENRERARIQERF